MSEKDLHTSIEADLKKAFGRAINCFGINRHWVELYVQPELERVGLTVVPIDEEPPEPKQPPEQFFTLRRVRQQIKHLLRKYRASLDNPDRAEVVEDLDTLQVLAEMED